MAVGMQIIQEAKELLPGGVNSPGERHQCGCCCFGDARDQGGPCNNSSSRLAFSADVLSTREQHITLDLTQQHSSPEAQKHHNPVGFDS
jgi:hypothetical protein